MVGNKQAKGDGSVYLRASDNRWCATLQIPSPDGKRRRKTLTAPTEAGAKAKLTQMRRARDKGELTTSRMTVTSWMDEWFNRIAVKKNKPKTAATYRSLIQSHIIPGIGKVRLANLTAEHIRKLEHGITAPKPEGKGLSSTTAKQVYQIVSVALRYAEQEGKVNRNVAKMADPPRKAIPKLAVLTPADGVKVLHAVAGDRLGSRWAAALLAGLRQGEALGLELDRVTDDLDLSWQLQRLTWEHGCRNECGLKRGSDCPARKITAPADWEHRYLTGGLWLSRPKSSAGWRVIPLVPPLREIIERRKAAAVSEPNPFGLLWTADPSAKGNRGIDGSPIDPKYDNYAWHAVLERASVHDARLHDARHTTASLLLAANVPEAIIVKILGHSSYAQSRAYQNVDRSQIESAMSNMSALMPLE